MSKLKYYVKSLRLRTLPLSVSGILVGASMAYHAGRFDGWIFVWAILTTICLQVLSNVSNEYGDAMNGADNAMRVGPIRSLQSGHITITDLKRLIVVFILLSVVFGVLLIISSFGSLFSTGGLIMMALGGLAIVAAVKYTIGSNNYGYKGFGDIAVFIFFGLVSVVGTYYLFTHHIEFSIFLPASGIGLLSVGVLNVNNIRDVENDRQCNKNTLVVKMGANKARIYHLVLITSAVACFLCYSLIYFTSILSWIYVVVIPLFVVHLLDVFRHSERKLDVQLRNLSVATLLLSILFGLSQII